ncbi:MAG: hypothetical protein P8J20_10110 [Novosphingobium sp.]|nr:hypothetical protein [Novosphingobium sp.]
MTEQATDTQAAAYLQRGQTFKFMPIPMIESNAEWFDAGPVSFAVEVRVLAGMDDAAGAGAGGGTIHVFSPDHEQEWVRFDCFDDEPHYHYLDQHAHLNTVWTYDDAVNGPMAPWAVSALRNNLPAILRSAGAKDMAQQVERDGVDALVLDQVEQALASAHDRSKTDVGLAAESAEWFEQWKDNNPDFKRELG